MPPPVAAPRNPEVRSQNLATLKPSLLTPHSALLTPHSYDVHRKDGQPCYMAGLWARWQGKEEVVDSCTIVTTDAIQVSGEVHVRIPMILSPESHDTWLDPGFEDSELLQPLLKPPSSEGWVGYLVGYCTRDDTPELIERK